MEGINFTDLKCVEVRAHWKKLAGFACPEEKGELARLLMNKGETLDSADILYKDDHTYMNMDKGRR